VQDVAAGKLAATAQQYPLRMAELGVEAALTFLTTGTKPSGFTDTGVALVTATPAAGVTSLTATEGAARCWGSK
jgi:fructose transport system substrate-binding protein